MRVNIESTYGDLNFKGTNDRGQSIQLSGNKEAVSPMESLLMALASCSAVDVQMILKKMRQNFQTVKVEIEGERADAVPAVFTHIQMEFTIIGDVKLDKAQKAVDLSLKEYCSVSTMLSKAVTIDYKVEVIVPEWNENI